MKHFTIAICLASILTMTSCQMSEESRRDKSREKERKQKEKVAEKRAAERKASRKREATRSSDKYKTSLESRVEYHRNQVEFFLAELAKDEQEIAEAVVERNMKNARVAGHNRKFHKRKLFQHKKELELIAGKV